MSNFELYTKNARIWISDEELVWKGAKLLENFTGQSKIHIETDDNQTITLDIIEKKLPPLRNPDILIGLDDLTSLSYLHEPAVLHNLQVRFIDNNDIYTYCGIVLVAINPYKQLSIYDIDTIYAYHSQEDLATLEPHIFAVAELAYNRLESFDENQSIIVSGESGAGKTVSAKYAMRYLATVCGAETETHVEKRVLASNPIMEAFGNAKTTRNDNSSRFGKYIEIGFSNKNIIIGAHISTYLLEKSRVVFQAEDERNYHVFYQLCSVCDVDRYAQLCLDSADTFYYTRQGKSRIVNTIDDKQDFYGLIEAFRLIGVNSLCEMSILQVLASILHIGNINIKAEGRNEDNSNINKDDESLMAMSELLGVDGEQMRFWICNKKITTNQETLHKPLSAQQASSVRDALAKHMYECLFDWIVREINKLLHSDVKQNKFIGILDIYGFETFEINSFEQFCINYANEKLQQQFCCHVFKLEQEEYVKEGIEWSHISFHDNQPCIQLIEDKLGILDLLDDECKMSTASDANWCDRLYERWAGGKHAHFEKPRTSRTSFRVRHFADNVEYRVDGFVHKNKDTIYREHVNILKASQYEFVASLFDDTISSMNDTKKLNMADRQQKQIKNMRKTVANQFKESLSKLMGKLVATTPHYVRCIKPNDDKTPFNFDRKRAMQQLRACGVLETIRISAAGFPSRSLYPDFVRRYRVLLASAQVDRADHRTTTQCLLVKYLARDSGEKEKYKLGKTKIFFRAGCVAYLEKCRTERLRACVSLMQKNIKRFLARNKYKKMRRLALLVQTQGRMILAKRHLVVLRERCAATRIVGCWKGYKQRKVYAQFKRNIICMQSCCRTLIARHSYNEMRYNVYATRIQSCIRGWLQRKTYAKMKRGFIMLQAHVRRRRAKKLFKQLKIEARSVERMRNIAKGLENKIIQLQQKLTEKNKEVVQLRDEVSQVADLKQTVQKLKSEVSAAKTTTSKVEDLDLLIKELTRQLEHEKQVNSTLQSQMEALSNANEEIASNHALEKSTLLQELSHTNQLLAQNEAQQQNELKRQIGEVRSSLMSEFEMERAHHQRLVHDHARLQQRFDNLKHDAAILNSPSSIAKGVGDFTFEKKENEKLEAMGEELEKRRGEVIELKSQLVSSRPYVGNHRMNTTHPSPDESDELKMAYQTQKELNKLMEGEIDRLNEEMKSKEEKLLAELQLANSNGEKQKQFVKQNLSGMDSGKKKKVPTATLR